MTWTKKSSAPTYFSLADAFLALITGDATWGWLVDWLTLVPNSGQNTADFCAEGPVFTEPLVVTDFIPTANPLDPRNAIKTAALAARIAAAARDRVFAAYCENPYAAGYQAPVCVAITAVGRGGSAFDSGLTIPAGASHVRITVTPQPIASASSDATIGVWFHNGSGLDLEGSFGAPGGTAVPFTGAVISRDGQHVYLYPYGGTADWSATICFEWDVPAGAVPHTPVAQPQPTGVSSPLRTVDPSLGGIAAELERVEFKLDTVWPLLQAVAAATIDLAGGLDTSVSLPAGTEFAVGDLRGLVVTVTGIPTEADIGFGVPQRLARLGYLNIGSADAWYPSVHLTHTPMLVRPLPPGATRVTVSQLPPGATATVRGILPLK